MCQIRQDLRYLKYIAQVKRKHGLIEGVNYNLGEKESKVPQVSPEKEQTIEDALKYFKMIQWDERILIVNTNWLFKRANGI